MRCLPASNRSVVSRTITTLLLILGVVLLSSSQCLHVQAETNPDSVGGPSSSSSNKTKTKRKRLAILTANLPWTFGPYQSQSHKLSLLLSHQYGIEIDNNDNDASSSSSSSLYDICWITFARQLKSIPPGEYESYDELKQYIPTVVPPPFDFVMDHITFIGTQHSGKPYFTASYLNKLAQTHDLSTIITLMDITRIFPDVPFTLPVVGWIPFHSDVLYKSTIEYWILRNYHGLAALAPSTQQILNDSVGQYVSLGQNKKNDDDTNSNIDHDNRRRLDLVQKITGKAYIDFIPHIIDWRTINDMAEKGYQLLSHLSVMDADATLWNKEPLRHRGMEELVTLQGNTICSADKSQQEDTNLFGTYRQDDFVVLLDGGNYDSEDRKGWDTSIQAFVQFYDTLPTDNNRRSHVHLLIHSIESYLVESDSMNNTEAPPAILPEGHLHHRTLHQMGLPRSAYTIDMNVHAEEVIAAYKKRANVCLHPSKVEGFGMNVLECQAVGTPVITTNYTAMSDFTFLGISVPIQQTIKTPTSPYRMGMPDVAGIADALRILYDEHETIVREAAAAAAAGQQQGGGGEERTVSATAAREKQIQETRQWLDSTFSSKQVGTSFVRLLKKAHSEYLKRGVGLQNLLQRDSPPQVGAYKVLSGYHLETADWDEPWTLIAPNGMEILNEFGLHTLAWKILLKQYQQQDPPTNLIRLLATHDDERNSKTDSFMDYPILVRTYVLAGLQSQATRRTSILYSIYGMMENPKQFPPGYVAVRSTTEPAQCSSND